MSTSAEESDKDMTELERLLDEAQELKDQQPEAEPMQGEVATEAAAVAATITSFIQAAAEAEQKHVEARAELQGLQAGLGTLRQLSPPAPNAVMALEEQVKIADAAAQQAKQRAESLFEHALKIAGAADLVILTGLDRAAAAADKAAP